MSRLRARPAGPPARLLVASAVAAAVLGGALVAAGPPAAARPVPLSPRTVLAAVRAELPAGVRAVRVDGLYGSGGPAGWQFVAFLTWRRPDGGVAGGRADLPLLTGRPLLAAGFPPARLAAEQRIGWPLDRLAAVLRDAPAPRPLAFVEVETTPAAVPAVLWCTGSTTHARCQRRGADGRFRGSFGDRLTDDPFAGPLAVQQASAPAVAP